MICIPRSRMSAEQLAREIAADPRERAILESIPRDATPARMPKGKSLFPAISEEELARGLRTDDPEVSLRGLIARVKLLEAQVAKLMSQKGSK